MSGGGRPLSLVGNKHRDISSGGIGNKDELWKEKESWIDSSDASWPDAKFGELIKK